jgi:hypothetical protein
MAARSARRQPGEVPRVGVGAVGVAGVKMGLSFNAQIESARLRFGLFTDDVDGLTKAVQKIDMKSAFNFGDLSDAAALFGNSGIKDIPDVLQAPRTPPPRPARAPRPSRASRSRCRRSPSKGRLSQEEINQLNEAGAPGCAADHRRPLPADREAVAEPRRAGPRREGSDQGAHDEWTSGKMAKAAEAQTKTLGGQWMLLTGNIQKLSGAATESLAEGLRDKALPAVNKAVDSRSPRSSAGGPVERAEARGRRGR